MSLRSFFTTPVLIDQNDKEALISFLGEKSCIEKEYTDESSPYKISSIVKDSLPVWKREPTLLDIPDFKK